MSTTIILTDDISVFSNMEITKAMSINYALTNSSTSVLDIQVSIVLVQHVGDPAETSTTLQSWKKFAVVQDQTVNFEGTYFVPDAVKQSIEQWTNPEIPQKYQIIAIIDGGTGPDRSLFQPTPIPNSSQYTSY
jgi:hypothetical protein